MTTSNLNNISTVCATMIADSLKGIKAIEDNNTAMVEPNQLFDAYVEANKAGDYALATTLKNKWFAATAGL